MNPLIWVGLVAGGIFLYRSSQKRSKAEDNTSSTPMTQSSPPPKPEQANQESDNRCASTEYAHKNQKSAPTRVKIFGRAFAAESKIALPLLKRECPCQSHEGKSKKDYYSVESANHAANDLFAMHGFVMEHYPCPEREKVWHLRSMRFNTRDEADDFQLRHYEIGFYWEVQERKGRFYLEPLTFDSKTQARKRLDMLQYIRGIEMYCVEDKGGFRLTKQRPKKSVH